VYIVAVCVFNEKYSMKVLMCVCVLMKSMKYVLLWNNKYVCVYQNDNIWKWKICREICVCDK